MSSQAVVEPTGGIWCRVSGLFFRAVDPAHRDSVLAGSRLAGRYSEASQPTLYLSSSPAGVDAAMSAHAEARPTDLVLVKFQVVAENIVDLRDPNALRVAGVQLADAVAPWQDVVKAAGQPSSWRVRQRLEALGANGLIDPSRTSPGLWHLTLFSWNRPGAPAVALD